MRCAAPVAPGSRTDFFQVSVPRTVQKALYRSTASILVDGPTRRKEPTHDETETPRISGRKTYFLVLWWMSQTPYAAIFENQVAAEAAANVRNALMVTISGRDVKVDQVQDW